MSLTLQQDDKKIIKEGYLLKQSKYLKQFRKRWVVLSHNNTNVWRINIEEDKKEEQPEYTLCSYQSRDKQTHPTEIIDLAPFYCVQKKPNIISPQFELISNDTTRCLSASSIEEMNDWIMCISNIIGQDSSGEIWSQHAKLTQNKKHIIEIFVDIKEENGGRRLKHSVSDCECFMSIAYIENETISTMMHTIKEHLRKTYYTLSLKITRITGFIELNEWNMLQNTNYDKSITSFERNVIKNKGLSVYIKPHYTHKIKGVKIDCMYMNKVNNNDPMKCPIYYNMMQNYQFNHKNLNHLNEFNHFEDETNSKTECKYSDDCKAYIRLENGGNKINDLCHVKLYKHPPRTRRIQLQENINSLIIHKSYQQNQEIYYPAVWCTKKHGSDGYLHELIEEVIYNGFRNDLCLECGVNDICQHTEYSILQIVDEKMNHIRHRLISSPLNRGEMLSLILYTGCDCNYDLCKEQRNGNYKKWKWFDHCLYCAITKLSERESGSFAVFSGLDSVKLKEKYVDNGYFVTYVSTSWDKEVAKSFMKGDGMIIEVHKKFKDDKYGDVKCCDVSWISKFPDECEILFARSIYEVCNDNDGNRFRCEVADNTNGIQEVLLYKKQY